jgi:hypothetical protein
MESGPVRDLGAAGDVFQLLPGTTWRQTVLLIDDNAGGGLPRILGRAVGWLRRGGRCVAEFDAEVTGIRASRKRLAVL